MGFRGGMSQAFAIALRFKISDFKLDFSMRDLRILTLKTAAKSQITFPSVKIRL